MKKFKSNFKILYVKRNKNSYSGNPAYCITVETKNGEILEGKTASNAPIGYCVSSEWINSYKPLLYHFTKNGNCIFDCLIN